MTRYKPIPEARSLTGLAAVQDALPLVPGSVDDCCLRLQQRADVPDRDSAQAWLPFLVALGLASEQGGSYYRERVDPDRERLAERFRDRVYGVREVLDTVATAEDPVMAADAFEGTRDLVPTWERNRDPDWEVTWRSRTRRCLDWAVVFGLLTETADGSVRRP